MVGEVLADRYELEELVGTGGMSSVYRAHDRLLDRKVALKVLHQQYTDDAEYVERFRHEARAGRGALASEHRHGDRPRRARRPPVHRLRVRRRREPEAADPARRPGAGRRRRSSSRSQIARGLAFAHQQGLVHRDVKPQNVLLNGNGQAKVTDFGIARSLDVQHGMTQTGHRPRHVRLHRARAGAGPARRRAHRRLLARRRPLRAAHGRGAVPRRELRRRRDAPHQRAAAADSRPASRCAAAARGGRAEGDGEGPARPLRDDGRLLPRARGVPGRGRRARRR